MSRDELHQKCLDYRKKIENLQRLPDDSIRDVALQALRYELLQTARQIEQLERYKE